MSLSNSVATENQISRMMKWHAAYCEKYYAQQRRQRQIAATKALLFGPRTRLTVHKAQAKRFRNGQYPDALLAQVEQAMREGLSLEKMSVRFGRSSHTCKQFVRAVLAKKSPPEGQAHGGQGHND